MPAIKDSALDLHRLAFFDIASSCLRSSVAISPKKRSVTTMATGCSCGCAGRTEKFVYVRRTGSVQGSQIIITCDLLLENTREERVFLKIFFI